MRIALLADIHGNLEALIAVLHDVALTGVDRIACLGDTVGYGPDPAACLDLVMTRCHAVVAGNHDEATVTPAIEQRFNESALEAIRATRRLLGLPHRAMLTALPLEHRIGDVALAHASFSDNSWAYLYGKREAAAAFAGLDSALGAIGHTHIPCLYTAPYTSAPATSDVRLQRLEGEVTVGLPAELRAIVNPGSVGQPRDGNPLACWGLLEWQEASFSIKRVAYDVAAVEAKIRKLGLPERYAQRLRIGA